MALSDSKISFRPSKIGLRQTFGGPPHTKHPACITAIISLFFEFSRMGNSHELCHFELYHLPFS